MLNTHDDDQLTARLADAFRESTEHLTWSGRVPVARRTPSPNWLAVPALAAASAVAAAVVVADGGSPVPGGPVATGSASPAPTTTGPTLAVVTDEITVAGYTMTYRHDAGEPLVDDLYAVDVDALPDGAVQVALPDPAPGVEAWVGTDPATGHHGVYVVSPIRNGGDLVALLSPTWTLEQMESLSLVGMPTTGAGR